jgi:hypothetical protein
MSKDELFVDKWLVIPAFYRDLNSSKTESGKPSLDVINKCYQNLLSLVKSNDSDFDFMGKITENKIQKQLVEIYELLTKALASKEGFIHHDLLGKTVDYSTRGVISASFINSNKYEDQLIKYGECGVPLAHLCNLFYPFFLYEIKSLLDDEFSTVKTFVGYNPKTKERTTFTEFYNPADDFSQDKIKKMINLFITSQDSRLLPVEFNTSKGKSYLTIKIEYEDGKVQERPMSILDLLYMSAKKIVVDKHVYVTRYPIETFRVPSCFINQF